MCKHEEMRCLRWTNLVRHYREQAQTSVLVIPVQEMPRLGCWEAGYPIKGIAGKGKWEWESHGLSKTWLISEDWGLLRRF